MFSFSASRAAKGGEEAVLTPQRVSPSWRCQRNWPRYPGRARRFLVAIALVRDLLLRAKHLFVAAMVCLGWGVTWVNDGAGLDGRRPATADTTVTAPTSPPRTDSGQSAPGAATGGEPRSRQAIITRAWLGRPIRSGARS